MQRRYAPPEFISSAFQRRIAVRQRQGVQIINYNFNLEQDAAEADANHLDPFYNMPPPPDPIRDYYHRMGYADLSRNPHNMYFNPGLMAMRIDLNNGSRQYYTFNENRKRPKSKKSTDNNRNKSLQQQRGAKKGMDDNSCKVFMKLKVDKFTVLVPHRFMLAKEVDYIVLRLHKLNTLCKIKFQNINDLLWNILKISPILKIESIEGILHDNGLYSVPMQFLDHLRFLNRLNFSHNLDVNDNNFQALRNYGECISYVNINGCLNLTSDGILTIRSLPKFKGYYLDILTQPRIFNAMILSRFSSAQILDPDSLSIIFSMVPLSEKIKLSDVCFLWKDIINEFWLKLKTLDSSTCPNKIDLDTFTKIVKRSKSLRNIDFNIIEGAKPEKQLMSLFTYMQQHSFMNLVSLNLSGITLTDKLLAIFMGKYESYPKMKKLTIGAHQYASNGVMQKVLGLPINLVYLRLTSNRSIHGDYLKDRFKLLETLQLNNCSQVTEHIQMAMDQMPNLKNLSITNCRNFLDPFVRITSTTLRSMQLSNNVPQVLIGTCHLLETLDLSHNTLVDDEYLKLVRENCVNLTRINLSYCSQITDAGVRHITSLPKIEHLALNSVNSVSDRYLTIYTLKTLECRNCPQFYNAGVIQLLSAASALELLDLTNCPYITQHLVEYAIKSTKKRTNGVTLTMYVGGTNVEVNGIMDESPLLNLVNVPEPRFPKIDESDSNFYYATIDQFDED